MKPSGTRSSDAAVRPLLYAGLAAALCGCAAGAFLPPSVATAPFVERSTVQTRDQLSLSAAVLDPEEAQNLIGVELYAQGIQPLWLEVRNDRDDVARLALASIDDEYFAPLEVAWMNRKAFKRQHRPAVERWFHEHGMPRRVPAGETRSGFVYTHVTPGTKVFNVDLYTSSRATSFTFFVPIPGFVPDYMDADLETVYAADEIRPVEVEASGAVLARYPCCSTDGAGRRSGGPLNVVLVGTGPAVLRALLRGGWAETHADSPQTALAREHRYRGRRPDAVFYRSRPEGGGRSELLVWLAPMRVGGDPVWLGQASYEMGSAAGTVAGDGRLIDPDVDGARLLVTQSLWYGQSLAGVGVVGGVPAATIDAPRRGFDGAEYFTDGRRVALFVSEAPVAMDDTVMQRWTEPAEQ